ncbi:MAG TPA: polysaccharide biosynthesis tyrosine autokinase [Blastocatellia bacterium]|nr:polysaccharide biosynthesis tyrosine autokinase [Blastocatellia bacterium]
MTEADKINPSPNNNDNTKLMESIGAANSLELRRDGYGRTYNAQPNETQVHLRDYWRIVRRRLWVPISVVLLTVTLVTIYMLRSPSIYEGQTTVQVDREDTASLDVNAKEFKILGPEDAQYINTQLKNIQSPTTAYKVAKILDLEHNPKFVPRGGRDAVKNDVIVTSGGDEQQADRNRLEPYVETLLANVEITRLRDTRLIQVKYRHTDRELAKKVTDTWAEVFRDDNLATRKQGSRDTASFLEEQISKAKLELIGSEEKLMNYRRSKQVIDFGESEKNTELNRLDQLNSELVRAENDRKTLQAFYELSRTITDIGTLPEIQRDPQVQEINKKLTDLREQKAKLDVEYTPEWPAVKQVAQQIEELESQKRAAYKRIQTALENQYRAADEREKFLRKAFEEQRSQTVDQQSLTVNARMLQQAVDTNRELYTKLLASQKDVTVSSAGIKSSIRITDYSALPRIPVGPKRLQNILLSLLLSLVGGVGLALFIDYINNKIESVEDIDRYLSIPVLGVIPVFPLEGKERSRVMGDTSSKKQLNGTVTMKPNTATSLVEVDNTSSIAESYRQLRTAVLLSSASHAPRTILVTSSQPAEGKTTTSTNLAISLSQTGASVLIVDCDLRRPRLHKVFGVKNSRGLANYLSGTGELASLVQPALPNLFVLPVGPLPPNPAELLGSSRMKQTIDLLQGSFDYVVLDSPPVASFADSLILSAMVEGVILVVKAGYTSREVANRTKTHLQTVGAKVLGAVINHIKLQPHDYYYYSTYYSRYYYRDESSETNEEK